MILFVIDHAFHYETEKLLRIFFPDRQIDVKKEYTQPDSDFVCTRAQYSRDGATLTVSLDINGTKAESSVFISRGADGFDAECERSIAGVMFDLLSSLTGERPPWGMLTGVRPSKLLRSLRSDFGEEAAVKRFGEIMRVSPEKTALALAVARAEDRIIALSRRNSFSLYVSIPFCPTRCSYCSFVSHSITSPVAKKSIDAYVSLLCDEIKLTAQAAKRTGLRLESIYWGGGTPTSLEARQLETILSAIRDNFDFSVLREYTVEAGRPDTITSEKLDVLKSAGVGRISINPQTFNDSVLAAIGRKHTAQLIAQAYFLARSKGFGNINMDLIAGLPTDIAESFKNSVNTAIALAPESITVHTLALKRSSRLVTDEGGTAAEAEAVREMVAYANTALAAAGYKPYYMYRQSKSLGNLENTGWCKPGFECLYNVFMMEECHTVLSVGAGAVTKLKAPDKNHIERIFNFKYPYEYIDRFNIIADRKKYIDEFYGRGENKCQT